MTCQRLNYTCFWAFWIQLEAHRDFSVVTRFRSGLFPPVLATAPDISHRLLVFPQCSPFCVSWWGSVREWIWKMVWIFCNCHQLFCALVGADFLAYHICAYFRGRTSSRKRRVSLPHSVIGLPSYIRETPERLSAERVSFRLPLDLQTSTTCRSPPVVLRLWFPSLVLHHACSIFHFCFRRMDRTPTSTRAGRKSKSKRPERKWCTCQKHCDGGKEVAASTYRSHNPAPKATTPRDGSKNGPVAVVGGKRKVRFDADGLDTEGRLRETRGTHARRVEQDGEPISHLSLTATEDLADTSKLDDFRPRKSKKVGQLAR